MKTIENNTKFKRCLKLDVAFKTRDVESFLRLDDCKEIKRIEYLF
jgi:hypothetical protein